MGEPAYDLSVIEPGIDMPTHPGRAGEGDVTSPESEYDRALVSGLANRNTRPRTDRWGGFTPERTKVWVDILDGQALHGDADTSRDAIRTLAAIDRLNIDARKVELAERGIGVGQSTTVNILVLVRQELEAIREEKTGKSKDV